MGVGTKDEEKNKKRKDIINKKHNEEINKINNTSHVKKKKGKKKIIIVIIIIIIVLISIVGTIGNNKTISSLQVKDNINYVGKNLNKYEVGTYNSNTLTTDDLYNFYRNNVEQGEDNILKDKGIAFILLKNKNNTNEGYYFTEGYFTKCQITNDDMAGQASKTWWYYSNTDSFKEVDG
ncbi:MAG: hypothetical protein SO136_00015 [Sarcina ventriculi]|nr:hypothetical protein [Sarcina ventriculi]MDD7372202.1 hypothetical protein [Sarcina ventriculi]MDY7061300.1 hypothetical protein [Sarcina ventriculi]